jgi:hypothetical protein
MDWITGSEVIGRVDHEGDGGILVDKQGSNACKPGCLEYPLLACARDDVDPGYVYGTSTDGYLVAWPAG